MMRERKYHLSKIKVTFCTNLFGPSRENNKKIIIGNFHSGGQKKLVQKSTTFIFFKK